MHFCCVSCVVLGYVTCVIYKGGPYRSIFLHSPGDLFPIDISSEKQISERRQKRGRTKLRNAHFDSSRHPACVDSPSNQITPWVLRQSRIHWKLARMIAKHDKDRWTQLISNWNPAISTKPRGYQNQGRPAKRWDDVIN